MRFHLCFALASLLALPMVAREAAAQGGCKHEPDFINKDGTECRVTADQEACAGLVRDNKQDWPIAMLFPVCLGRSETLANTGHVAHSVQCNRYYTDKHTAYQNKLMMECAYRGMFGRGVIWVDDDPRVIYESHQHRQFAYAEVVFMKNVLCRLPEQNKLYLHP